MPFYVSLAHRNRKRPTHRRFVDLDAARMFAVERMYRADVTAYAVCQVRVCKQTREKIVTLIDGLQKPERPRVIRGVGGAVLLRLRTPSRGGD